MGTELKMQPTLIHVPNSNDIVYTPAVLARDIINFFQPSGFCLDPCVGSGAFFDLLPAGSEWCEIERGRDFYAWVQPVDWIVGNPPYSHYSAWLRHSMRVAREIVYLMPVYKVFASGKFLEDLFKWGGLFTFAATELVLSGVFPSATLCQRYIIGLVIMVLLGGQPMNTKPKFKICTIAPSGALELSPMTLSAESA